MKTIQDLYDELSKEWKWYHYIHSWYLRTLEWFADLYRNLKPRKLKQLLYFIRYWWNYWGDWDYGYALNMLHWQLCNLLNGYNNDKEIGYVGMEYDKECLEKLVHHLEIFIKEDYGDISEIGLDEYNRRYDENKSEMLKYFGMIDKFWI